MIDWQGLDHCGIAVRSCQLHYGLDWSYLFSLVLFAFGDSQCWLVLTQWIDLMIPKESKFMFHKHLTRDKSEIVNAIWNKFYNIEFQASIYLLSSIEIHWNENNLHCWIVYICYYLYSMWRTRIQIVYPFQYKSNICPTMTLPIYQLAPSPSHL